MDFNSLANRLNSLPLILAGPIVRRTEPKQVTVWVALKAPRKVTLHIYKKIGEEPLFSSAGETIALGDNLHLLAVTAKAPINALMLWGIPYYYDMDFDSISGDSREDVSLVGNLNTENIFSPVPELKMLTYNDDLLPSFILPAEELSDLRIIHSSCRKPHGEGEDMLAKVDELIDEAVKNPAEIKRPQQLFLTGDQIYADDVAPTMLAMLMDASEALLGRVEKLPDLEVDDPRLQPKWHFKLTSESLKRMKDDGHPEGLVDSLRKIENRERLGLVAFKKLAEQAIGTSNPSVSVGEEAMKRFLSIARKYATHPDRRSALSKDTAKFTSTEADNHLFTAGEYWMMYLFVWSPVLWSEGLVAEHEIDNRVLNVYKNLLNVRRALANISTYMICDDHEITDDWFLNLQWCADVFGSQLGRRILLNGMLGYALFQAWGNNPEQFENKNSGQEFLKAVQEWKPQEDAEHQKTIQKKLELALGIADADMVKEMKRARSLHVLHTKLEEIALNWHYHVPGSKHQVVVLDTRTWRTFPGKELSAAEIEFPTAELNDGYNPPALIKKENLNIQIEDKYISEKKDITFIVSASPVIEVNWVSSLRSPKKNDNRLEKDYEDWEFQPRAFWDFLERLSSFGKYVSGVYKTKVIFLSGDIHYGYTSRMKYHKDENVPDKAANAIYVQLNSSALKNQDLKTKTAQYFGYEQVLLSIPLFAPPIAWFFDFKIPRSEIRKDDPDKANNAWHDPIEHIIAQPYETVRELNDSLKKPDGENKIQDMKRIRNIGAGSRVPVNYDNEIVGRNNIGRLHFSNDGNTLHHLLFWKNSKLSEVVNQYEVNLRFS